MNRSRGFGILELLILLFVLGVLAVTGVGVVSSGSRNSAKQRTCQENLIMIDGAKEQWSIMTRSGSGSLPTKEDLLKSDEEPGESTFYLRNWPVCPGGGTYSLNAVGKVPTCSLGDAGDTKHALPQN